MTAIQIRGKEFQVMKFAHCLRIVSVIEKYAYIFGWEGEDEFSTGRVLYEEDF